MSYLNQTQDFRSRFGGLAGTVAINAVIGLGVVTGLSFAGTHDVRTIIDTFDVPAPTPPPPDPQPVPPEPAHADPLPFVPQPPLPPLAPHTEIETTDAYVPEIRVDVDPGPAIVPIPTPRPTLAARGARPSNNSAAWITTDDYPRGSLIDQSEGSARYSLLVGTDGRVSNCTVTRSTGDRRLDDATCKYIVRRARFAAATDENGAKVAGSYSGTVTWQIPD